MVLFLYILFVVDVVYTTVHMETVRARMEKLARQMRDRKECYLYMAGEQKETSAAYMLKRFLETLNAEIKRRKLLLSL